MSLNSCSVLTGATITPSGGSAVSFEGTGPSNNSHTLICTDDTSLLTRRTITAGIKAPKVSSSAPGGYTQARGSVVLKFPKTLDNGNTTVDTVRIEVSYDPENTESEVDNYCDMSSQVLSSSAFRELFTKLNLS